MHPCVPLTFATLSQVIARAGEFRHGQLYNCACAKSVSLAWAPIKQACQFLMHNVHALNWPARFAGGHSSLEKRTWQSPQGSRPLVPTMNHQTSVWQTSHMSLSMQQV
jgi:hypothetical protein